MTETILSSDEKSTPQNSTSIDVKALVVEIVASYVANNHIEREKLPELFQMVHQSLSSLKKRGCVPLSSQPAVPIEESIHPDYLVCLEDGKRLKILKRHLRTAYNMTPEQYRMRWNLPSNYPMVAPNYSKIREQLAKE